MCWSRGVVVMVVIVLKVVPMTTRPKRTSFRPSSADAMELRVADEAGPSVECPICLRDDAAASLHKTACGHGICERCLRSYIESSPRTRACTARPVCRQPRRPQTTSARHHRVYRWCRHLTFGRGRASSVGRAASVHPLFSLRYSSGTSAEDTACTEAYRKRSSSPFYFLCDQRKTPHTHTTTTHGIRTMHLSLTGSHMQLQHTATRFIN